MEHNPYQPEYHNYLESLKEDLGKATSYVPSSENPIYVPKAPSTNLVKYIATGVAVLVVGVSVVSFLTQGILLVFNKGDLSATQAVKNDQEKADEELKKIYVRADLERGVFATTTDDVSKYYNNVNIPGVARIGYDDSMGNSFLTDNINKYSDKTLVLGTREIPDQMSPGGEDETLIDKYDLIPGAIVPNLNSKAYILADLDTGEVILDKNSDTIYPIASVSKLMTAVIATEKMNLQDVAIVSKDATNAYGAQGSLALGEKIRLADLLYPLVMESSNDAAEVFADHFGHQEFMDEMNKKAASIGMESTYYNDPSGLDPKNTSNPKDLLKLVRYIWKKDPSIFDVTRVKQFSIKGHTWLNRNPQLPLSGYIGGKNGYIDQALQTTASIFEIPTAKGGTRRVVIVVLKSNNKNNDVIKLINFMKKYVTYTP